MPKNWTEYLQEKQKLADRQALAVKQPTPATRLAFYHSANLPSWHVQPEVIRLLDKAFEENDFTEIHGFTWRANPLIVAVARAMEEEVILRLSVENKELAPEKYKPAWWTENPQSMA